MLYVTVSLLLCSLVAHLVNKTTINNSVLV
jgi:hypothetical protein